MSIGLSYLDAIMQSGSRQLIRELRRDVFLPDELPAYDFFVNFYRQYGEMPTREIMAHNGCAVVPATGPAAYLSDQVLKRAKYNLVRAAVPQFQAAITNIQTDALTDIIRGWNQELGRFEAVRDVFTLPEGIHAVMEAHDIAREADGEITGITMGWPALDALTSGAQPGEVVTFVARPNIGKSFTIAYAAVQAWRQGRSILFVTMEMTVVGMVRRILGIMAGINPDLIKRGQLSMFGEALILDTLQAVEGGPTFTMVAGNLSKTVSQVDALVQEYSPDAIYIDASYLMDPEKKRNNAKMFENLADVGKEIAAMALARRRPVFQTVQFNRQQKKDAKAELENIGGTDVVGQISSIVVGIREGDVPNEASQRVYEIAKNRDGPKGSMRTNFLFQPLNFAELPPDEDGSANVDWMV